MGMPKTTKLTYEDKKRIGELHRSGKRPVEIASELGMDARVVNGFVQTALRRGTLGERPGPSGAPPPPSMGARQADQLAELSRKWKSSTPDAEFSMHLAAGEVAYLAAYKEGVVLRVNKGRKASAVLLTPFMALRLTQKLSEFANWSRMP